MIIGITGAFGSGKSTVAAEFGRLGFKVINADNIGHKLLDKKPIKEKVISKFGKEILTKNYIDRKKLKDIVFYDKGKLIELNRIIHPEIIKEIKTIIKNIQNSKNKNAVVDGALLVEAGFKGLDRLVVVKISRQNQMERLLKNGKYNKEEINNIIKSQLPQSKKLKYADFVIDNNKDLHHLRAQVEDVYGELNR